MPFEALVSATSEAASGPSFSMRASRASASPRFSPAKGSSCRYTPRPRSARAIRQRSRGWQSIGSSDASCPQYSKKRLGLAAIIASRRASSYEPRREKSADTERARECSRCRSEEGEPIYALAQLRRADSLVATHRVETLRRKRGATSFRSGEFRLQCCSPPTVESNARSPELSTRLGQVCSTISIKRRSSFSSVPFTAWTVIP